MEVKNIFDYGQLFKIPTVIMRGGTSKGLPNEVNANAVLIDTLEKIRVKVGIKIGLITEGERFLLQHMHCRKL